VNGLKRAPSFFGECNNYFRLSDSKKKKRKSCSVAAIVGGKMQSDFGTSVRQQLRSGAHSK
jgi:hypothetical protein